jgi:ABC-type proline/glycine betaine transport system ATPase subunit
VQWRRERVGFVFQSFALLPLIRRWNIDLMLRLAGKDRRERRRRAGGR